MSKLLGGKVFKAPVAAQTMVPWILMPVPKPAAMQTGWTWDGSARTKKPAHVQAFFCPCAGQLGLTELPAQPPIRSGADRSANHSDL